MQSNLLTNLPLSLTRMRSSGTQLLITDLLGNEVYNEMLIGSDNAISISAFSEGIYFYEVRGLNGSERGKFMVQK